MSAFPMIQPTGADFTRAGCLAHLADIPMGLARIVVAGADRAGVTVKELRSECRVKKLFNARLWVILEARRNRFSYPEIARALSRDHTTIMHAAKRKMK